METESKEEEWKNSITSSSRSSSITSDSSDVHFGIAQFPLPRPSLSASEAQKQREEQQTYNSSVSSYTGSYWSPAHQNQLVDLHEYALNRIPSTIFSSKPAYSTEWSIASNESLFSIQDGNFSVSTREDHGLAAALRSREIPRFEETVHEITEINPVTKPKESEKKPYQVEISVSEIDDTAEEEEEEEEEEDVVEGEALVEIETENPEEKEIVEHVKPEYSNSTTSQSPSISCRSETSNNSIGSFAFPVLQKEDGVVKPTSMEIRENVSHNPVPEYQLTQSCMQPHQPQLQSKPQPQLKASKSFESQTHKPKAYRNGWFACFHCPLKCGLFK